VIRDLGNRGKTILLSSHVLADVEDVCDRVTILYGGQPRAVGDINDLLRRRDVTEITTPPLSEETIEQLRDLIRRLEKKEVLGVSNPRVKLEEYFLKIVEEAQAQRIRTSGAVAGSGVPDFLKKATETTTTEEFVESLISAASAKQEPVEPQGTEPTPVRREKEPAEDVLGQLLGSTDEQKEEQTDVAGVPAPKPAPPEPERPRKRTEADSSVIDSLIHRADDQTDEQREDTA
jgi:ABC-2 type transport system ATP-binding protein